MHVFCISAHIIARSALPVKKKKAAKRRLSDNDKRKRRRQLHLIGVCADDGHADFLPLFFTCEFFPETAQKRTIPKSIDISYSICHPLSRGGERFALRTEIFIRPVQGQAVSFWADRQQPARRIRSASPAEDRPAHAPAPGRSSSASCSYNIPAEYPQIVRAGTLPAAAQASS